MKKSEINRQVIENFILHITHCSGGEDNYEELIDLTPKQLYEMADDYIKEDHVDGEGNPEDLTSEIVYSTEISIQDILDNSPEYVKDFYQKLSEEDKKEFIDNNIHSARKGAEWGLSDPMYDVISTIGQNLESNKEFTLVELVEPSVDENGRTANGVITMILTLGEYEVSYVNENSDCTIKTFDNPEDADAFLNELKQQHPECI